MITIATNINKKLSTAQVKSIQDLAEILFGNKLILQEYKEKSVKNDEQPKFFFGNLPLKEILNDIMKWDQFEKLIHNIYSYSNENIPGMAELQFWLTSESKPLQVNIFFSFKKVDDIGRLQSLRDTLSITEVFEEKTIPSGGKVLVVGFDHEGDVWRLNYL